MGDPIIQEVRTPETAAQNTALPGKEEAFRLGSQRVSIVEIPFYKGLYLEERYFPALCSSYEASVKGMFSAIARKDVRVVDYAISALFQLEAKKLEKIRFADEDGSGQQTRQESYSVDLTTFQAVLGERCQSTDLPATEETSSMAWFNRNVNIPNFDIFCQMVAGFVAGFCSRGEVSKTKQKTKGLRMCAELAGTGYLGPLPQCFDLSFLDRTKNTTNQCRCAAGVATWLSATNRKETLLGSLIRGIIRPVCSRPMTSYTRVLDFHRQFSSEFFGSDNPLLAIPSFLEATKAALTIFDFMVEMKKFGAESEVLTARTINPGVFAFLGEEKIKKGAALYLFATCFGRGKYWAPVWKAFYSNEWAKRKVDVTDLEIVKRCVECARARRRRILSMLTGLTPVNFPDDSDDFGLEALARAD